MIPLRSARQLQAFLLEKALQTYDQREAEPVSTMLTEWLTGYNRTEILADKPWVPLKEERMELERVTRRISEGEPVQYIMGFGYFYGRKFKVNPSVLIPRQETEELVHRIIADAKGKDKSILDIGTGSGCIAVTLASALPGAEVEACDISEDALKVARRNAMECGAKVEFFIKDILNEELDRSYDIIVSNPPYIPATESSTMDRVVVDFEPELALFTPDEDPLVFYRRILDLSEKYLREEGTIYVEIHEDSGEEVMALARDRGFDFEMVYDLNGKARIGVMTRV